MLTKEEATKQIAEKLREIDVLMKEAETLADKAGVSFRFDGPVYGMGGSYISRKAAIEESDWDNSGCSEQEDWSESTKECELGSIEYGWQASANSC